MPRLVDGLSRSDSVALAVGRLIADEGITALSLRAVAVVSGVSASGLVDHFGSRDRMLEVSAGILGRARLDAVQRRRHEGVLAFLPASPESVVDTRVWLGVCELGRGHVGVGYRVRAVRREERDLLGWLTRLESARPAGRDTGGRHTGGRDTGDVDTLRAVVDGLDAAVCDPDEPMPVAHARELLAAYLRDSLRPAS